MQDKLEKIINTLGSSETIFIKEHYYDDLVRWAKLIDSIGTLSTAMEKLPENFGNDFNSYVGQYNVLLDSINGFRIGQESDKINQIKSYYESFRNNYYVPLLNIKRTLEASQDDYADIEALKKIVQDAKRERKNFEKSFTENLEKQSTGSQRTLATYFENRLKDLRANKETNPNSWLKKRNFWATMLALSLVILGALYIVLAMHPWFKDYQITVGLAKLALVALIYTQYYFATKNYHIYADLTARYEHMTVISKTMTDFTAAGFNDDPLRDAILSNASKTLFSEITTGHLKEQSKDTSVFENIINQVPKSN